MQRDNTTGSTTRRVTAVLAGLTLVLVACSTTGRPEAIDDPPDTTTTTTTTSTPQSDAPDDEVVWQAFTRGGFVPEIYTAGQVPEVTIYRDGRVITTAHDPEDRAGPPVALELGHVSQAKLDAFLADADASGLFDPLTDFGSPGVTDQPSTTVLLRTGDTPQQVDVYALDFAYEQPVGDVTAEQTAHRTQLKALLARAAELGDHAKPYVPDRVRASRFDPSIVVDPAPTGLEWPGPELSSFPPIDDATGQSCLVI